MAGYIVTSPNGIDVPDPDDDTVVHYASGAVVPLSKFLPSSYKWLVKNGLISETESGFSGGGGGSSTWGGITGTLSDQTDLQTVLNAKAPAAGPTFTGTVVLPSTTSIGTVTNVEIGYLSGVTSSIQTQLGGKAASSHTHAQSDITNLVTDLSAKAPLASPSLTGTPLSTTAAVDTNTTQIATTAYVVGQGYLKSATASSTYAPIASPTFTGTVTLPSGTSIGTVSNTEIGYLDGVSSSIQTQISDRLPLGGGTLTGGLSGTTLSLSSTLSVTGNATFTAGIDYNNSTYQKVKLGGTVIKRNQTGGFSGLEIVDGSDNINAEIMVNGFATFKGDITINKGSSPALILGSSGPNVVSGSGTPEAVVTAPIGSIFLRSNGSAATTLYIKESGTGNTGWVAANPVVPEPVIALAVGDSVPGGTPSGTIIVRYTP